MEIMKRVRRAWNVFTNRDPTYIGAGGYGYSQRPYKIRQNRGNERSVVNAVFNRISMDVASLVFEHVMLDDNERYVETVKDGLHECLTVQANCHQTGRELIQDIVMSMFDEGCVAIVPVDMIDVPDKKYLKYGRDIETLRTGRIVEWLPQHVKVSVYNEMTGLREDVLMSVRDVAVVENPFYTIMNEPNSTVQRLIRKLNLLDAIDEQSGSGRLDLLIQLPYSLRSEGRRKQADERKNDIEDQLFNSKYGIAYIDATEKVTQLNRPVDNNLSKQVEYLMNLMFSQLGITQSIMDGTADEQTMTNYYNRTVEPVAAVICDKMHCTFLSKEARLLKHAIRFFRDPFKLMGPTQLIEASDKLTRNEIASSNEMRHVIGWRPSKDPKADELRNKNLNYKEGTPTQTNNDKEDKKDDV